MTANDKWWESAPVEGDGAAWWEAAPVEDVGPKTSNPLRGLQARAYNVIGSGIRGVATLGERIGDKLESVIPLSGLTPEQVASQKQLAPLFGAADWLDAKADAVGYAPRVSGDRAWEAVTTAPTGVGDVLGRARDVGVFAIDSAVSSLPDMAGAIALPLGYMLGRTSEIGEQRAINDNRSGGATLGDMAAAAPAAAVEVLGERLAAKFIPGLGNKPLAGGLGARTAKQVGIQAGTEGVQGGAAYLGETLGTETGTTGEGLAQASVLEALGGFGMAAPIAGVDAATEIARRRAIHVNRAPNAPKIDPGYSVNPDGSLEIDIVGGRREGDPAVPPEPTADLDAMLAPLGAGPSPFTAGPTPPPVLDMEVLGRALGAEPTAPDPLIDWEAAAEALGPVPESAPSPAPSRPSREPVAAQTQPEVAPLGAEVSPPPANNPDASSAAQPAEPAATLPAPPAIAPVDAPTMQNRDRSRAASVAQMQDIRRNPDPERLGFSRDPNTGAPMVGAAQSLPPGDLGRVDTVVMASGRRVPVQYAVVEADDLAASHDADGRANPGYGSAPLKALNNGRTAGLQAAYASGNTDAYRQGIAADAGLHGVSPEAIASKRNPVLVRLYDPAQNTGDMGAESNASAQLGLSPTEQAQTDARSLPDLSGLTWSDDGNLSPAANVEFFRKWFRNIGEAQAATLQDAQGRPNALALQRVKGALVQRAYGDERLLTALSEDVNPDNRNVMNALVQAAPAFATLDQDSLAGEIRAAVVGGLELLRDANARGLSLRDAIAQGDLLGRDPHADAVAQFMAANARSANRMAEAFKAMAAYADNSQRQAATLDVFGSAPTPSVAGALGAANIEAANDAGTATSRIAEGRGGGEPAQVAGAAAGDAFALAGTQAEPPAQEVAPSAGLFGAPTARDFLDARQRDKDAQRDGKAGTGRTDMLAGDGELFAGARPEQADIATGTLSAQDGATYGDTRPLQIGEQRPGPAGTAGVEAGRRGPAPVRGQLDLFVATRGNADPGRGHEPAVRINRPGLAQAVGLAQIGQFRSGHAVVDSLEKAAHILAPLRKSAQEQFLVLVLGGGGKPLGVIRHTVGTIDASLVDVGAVFGAVASVPGARQVVFGHNHPSGRIDPSSADLSVDRRLRDLMRGSGIEVMGSVIVAPGERRFSAYGRSGTTVADVKAAGKTVAAVPSLERRLTRIDPARERVSVATTQGAVMLARSEADGKNPSGVILLDTQNRHIGTVALERDDMMPLRTGEAGSGVAEIARRVSGANAAAAIVYGPGYMQREMDNLGAAIKALDVRVLDQIHVEPGESGGKSQLQRGKEPHAPAFEQIETSDAPAASGRRSAEESRRQGEETADLLEIRDAVDAAVGPGRVIYLHDHTGLPDRLRKGVESRMAKRGGKGRTAALYDQQTKQVYLFTDVVTDPKRAVWHVMHEIAGHHGLREFLGDRLDRALEMALQNPTVRSVADAIAKERGIDMGRQSGRLLAAEEALAELAAAVRTENYREIERRYGVEVGEGIRARVAAAVENFLRRLKAALDDLFGNNGFSDEDVRVLLENAWQAAQDESAIGTPEALESVEATPDRQQVSQARANAEAKRNEVAGSLGVSRGTPGWDYDNGKWIGRKGQLSRARMALQDKMLSWRDAQRQIASQLRAAIPDAMNVYRLENLMHVRVQRGIERIKNDQVKPLLDAMKAAGVKPEALEQYLYARHAQERNERIASINPAMPDGGSGMTTAEAQRILDGADPKLAALARRVDAIIRATRRRMLEHGLVTQEQHDALDAMYEHYVPLRGKAVQEGEFDADLRGNGGGRGIDSRGKMVREALGRGKGNRAANILGEVIGDAQRSIILAEKARVGRAAMRLALANPNPNLWTVEPVQTEQALNAAGEVYEKIINDWSDPSIIAVRHKGKLYRLQVHAPQMAQALNLVGVEQMHAIYRVGGKINRYFSAVLTKYDPAFIAANASRDLIFGLTGMASEHGAAAAARAVAVYPAAAASMYRMARNSLGDSQTDRYAEEFTSAGGRTGYVAMPSVEDIARDVNGLTIGGPLQDAKRAAKAVADLVGAANDAVENALRLASYIALRERGASVEAAAEYAKNLTVNFNRKGTAGSRINAALLFFNASMQGAHRSIKVLSQPKALAAVGTMAAAQAVLALMAMGLEDDDGEPLWNKVPEHVKRRNLVIITPDKGIITVPMPYGFNALVYAGGRTASGIANHMRGDTSIGGTAGDWTADIMSAALEAFVPIPVADGAAGLMPQPLRIAENIRTGKNDLGYPIRRENPYSDVPRASMGRPDTLEVFKITAKGLNRLGGGDDFTKPKIALLDRAPEDIEYLLSEIGGGLGKFIVDTATLGEKALDPSAPIALRDVPIINRFASNIDELASQRSLFYERKEVVDANLSRVRVAYGQGRPEEVQRAQEMLQELPGLKGVRFKRRKNPSENGPAGGIITNKGKPQFEAVPGSAYAAFREADKAIDARSQAIKDAYGDAPPTLLRGKEGLERNRVIREADAAMAESMRKFSRAWTAEVVGALE